MTKKSLDQDMSYREELLNSIEPNFIFSKKPINRFKIQKTNSNSIQNCNLKDNSKKLIMGDGNINSPIMIIGEAPGEEEEKTEKTFQGESGALLEKMLKAIDILKNDVYSTYAINFRPPEDRKPTTQ